ncbi:MAG TPA: HDIG domain-containing protein [Candidatus Limnocylindria bacterium]|jgi:putative nucleotidyltransferase with HDIG domain|nr:HDIG domain-containing protein [Candidatus Limnocylindria bacterium]
MFIPRTLAETEGGGGRGPWARALIVGGLLAGLLWAIMTLQVGGGALAYKVGDVAQADIIAPASQTFISDSKTRTARQEAADAVETVYVPIAPSADISDQQLTAYGAFVDGITRTLQRRDSEHLSDADVISDLTRVAQTLTDAQRQRLANMPLGTWQKVADAGATVLEAVQGTRIDSDKVTEAREQVRTNITNELSGPDRELAGDITEDYVLPNYQPSESQTVAARQAAMDAVPDVRVSLEKDQTILRRGEVITDLHLEELDALGLSAPRLQASTVGGNALVAVLLSALLVGVLWRFEPAIWFRNRSLLLFGLALLGTAVAIRISADRTLWTYVVPTAATVLLTGILLEGAAGAAMAVALAVLAGVMNSSTLWPALYTLAGGLAALTVIVRAERLNAFVRGGLVLAVTNIGVLLAFNLLQQRDVTSVLQGIAAGSVNAALAVVLAVGSFAVIGNLFGIMTVFQLLELANPSSRLLRRLLLETPGTYHHSVMVGNLAERAAETIGADPLLARVAAYYHDIGKMKNPLAFIENQAGERNIHDDLSAEVSARIISSHIRDGIDLGYEYGLPVQIIGFIPQHHGTSVMSYFYGKALQEVGGNEELVPKDLYRYPGPKPQSREAAILMLSDGVEASVRSLDDKDEASIRAMVDRIVDARVEDGQLDDAELTLKNISQIKDAFVQQLLGMYHSRIKYPDNVVPLEPPRRERA